MRTTLIRADHPRPVCQHDEVHEVRDDEFIFIADDLPVLEMTELAPGVWGLPPVEFR